MPTPKDPQKQTSEKEVAQSTARALEKASWLRVAVREGFYVLPPQTSSYEEISRAFAELRTLIRYIKGVLDNFDERRREDPSFIKSETLVQSIELSGLNQSGEMAMRLVEFLEELHSRVPLLEGDVEEFNVLSKQYNEQRWRFYEWCKLAARTDKSIPFPILKTEDEYQRVESVRKQNRNEKYCAMAIRFCARVFFALAIGFIIFKIR